MNGYLALVLHAHLPFVRHPEHPQFLEESWFFEAVVETYLPLLRVLRGWERDGVPGRLTFTLTPTLCAMLRDPLLQDRCARHLDNLVDLAEKELHRTLWERALQPVAQFYHERLAGLREDWHAARGDLVACFKQLQDAGRIEIVTCAATHALLPLLMTHPPALRAQIRVARDYYRDCFGRDPTGIWLPECAYTEGLEVYLQEVNLRWFIVDSHGLLNAQPRPQYGMFAPVFTNRGVAAFGRDHESARQVWSRHEGYPGDPRYRDFYRDAGFDLDFDYLKPHLAYAGERGFTGIKYHRIGGGAHQVYERPLAMQAVADHAEHFVRARRAQITRLNAIMDRPPILVCPYDAELFGHWWFEGPEFIDQLVRRCAAEPGLKLISPADYLRRHQTNQLVTPAASSWGEQGHWRVWLNETNHWVQRHLQVAQERLTSVIERQTNPTPIQERALRQAVRELLLAQASDWPFILRTGSNAEYARKRVEDHVRRFTQLYEQLQPGREVDEAFLADLEFRDNVFENLIFRNWS